MPGLSPLLLEPLDTFKKAMGKKTGPSAQWLTDAVKGTAKLSGKKTTSKLIASGTVENITKYVEKFSINDAAMAAMNACVKERPADPFAFVAASFAARAELNGLLPAMVTTLQKLAVEPSEAPEAAFVESVCPAAPAEPEPAVFLTEEPAAEAAATGDEPAAAAAEPEAAAEEPAAAAEEPAAAGEPAAAEEPAAAAEEAPAEAAAE